MSHLHRLDRLDAAEWEDVPAQKIVAGAPRTRIWVQYEQGALAAGLWEASLGAWRVAYTEWEYVVVIAGRCVLTGDDGSVLTAAAGDAFVIEPGFTGIWDVVEPMKKHWVVRV